MDKIVGYQPQGKEKFDSSNPPGGGSGLQNLKTNLSEISTKELVDELRKRPGVESHDIPVEGYSEIKVRKDRSKNRVKGELKVGPAIILRIID